MRKSQAITLLFVSLIVAGCDDGPYDQDFYTSKADCVKEWNDEGRCHEGSHGIYGHGFYGPHYYGYGNGLMQLDDGHTVSRGGSGSAVSTAKGLYGSSSSGYTSRGGFGGSGRSFGGGISS